MTGANEQRPASKLRRKRADRQRLTGLGVIGISALVLGLSSGCAAPVSPELAAASANARDADEFLVVDCLLPGRVRHLGTQVTYLEARRATKTTAGDCAIRGGEYTGYDRANYATALAVWLEQAEAGDPKAQTYVAEIHEKGLGREPDYAMAALWYQRAADQGYATAQINLGQLYELGLGVPPDSARALELYREASGLEGEFVPAEELRAISQRQAEYEAVRRQLRERTQEAEQLRREMRSLNDEVDALRKRPPVGASTPAPQPPEALAAKQLELAKKQAALAQLDRQIAFKSQELAMRESQLDDIEREIVVRNAEIERLATITAVFQRDQQSLAQAHREASAAEAQLDEAARRRDEAIRERDAALAAQQAEIARLERAASALTEGDAAIAAQQRELAALRQEIDALEQRKAAQAAETTGQLATFDQGIADAQRQLAALDREIAQKQGDVAALDREIDGSRQTRLDATKRLEAQVRELEQGRSQAAAQGESQLTGLASQLAGLTARLADKRSAIARSEAELERTQGALSARRAELAASDETLASRRSELAANERALASQRQKVAAHDATLTGQQRELTANEATLAAQRNQLAANEAKAAAQREKLAGDEASLAAQRQKLAANAAALAAQQAELAAGQASLSNRDEVLGAGDQALANKQAELADSERALAKQRADLLRADAALARQQNELARSDEALTQQKAELARANEALVAQRAELARTGEAFARRQAELARTDEVFAERQGELTRLNAEIDRARAERAASQNQKTQQIAALEGQIALLGSQVEQLAPQVESFERRRAEAEALEARMSELRAEVASLEGQVREQQEVASTIEVAGPVIEMIEPRIARTRGVHLVRTIVLQSTRVVLGRVTAPAGVLSVMVNEIETQVAANGLFRAEVSVGQGDTPVEVVAVDQQGKRDSMAFLLSPSGGPPSVSSGPPLTRGISFGNYYALVVGNNTYPHLPNLVTPRNDAEEVSKLLKERYGFRVTTLYDANRGKILRALNALRGQLTENDNLLVYYAGHGELDRINQRGNWLPVDAEPDDTTNWISNITLTDILHNMTAKHVMVVADSCYSGALLTRSTLTSIEGGLTRSARFEVIKQGASKRSRTALTSGAIAPVLDGGTETNNSVFARALLDVLRENQDVLDGQGLHRSVAALVARATAARGFEQSPQYEAIKGDGHEIGGEFFFVPEAAASSGLGESETRVAQSQ